MNVFILSFLFLLLALFATKLVAAHEKDEINRYNNSNSFSIAPLLITLRWLKWCRSIRKDAEMLERLLVYVIRTLNW